MESRELAKQICEALADKKGEDIKILNISEVTVLADYFIIASGSWKMACSHRQRVRPEQLQQKAVLER